MDSMFHILKIGFGGSLAFLASISAVVASIYAAWRLNAIIGRPIGRVLLSGFPQEKTSDRAAREALHATESQSKLGRAFEQRAFNEKYAAFTIVAMLATLCMIYEGITLGEMRGGKDDGDEEKWESWNITGVAYAGVVFRGLVEGFIAQGVLALAAMLYERQGRVS
ncbi:hypothetical protein KC365_g18303 [Hortaea werneckii]|nr:hypothetical protein KC323_g8829 [Hortaea werneckii]KAI7203178.1 hypothetical protein KC365_g18303 [Hortaea werneckii]